MLLTQRLCFLLMILSFKYKKPHRLHCCGSKQMVFWPCPSPSPGVCSNSCLLSQWCYLTISSSDVLFSFAFSLSQHQCLLQWVVLSHQVAKVLELSFSISPSNEYSGLISFRIDGFDLLAVQGTLKSFLQCHSLKVSTLLLSAFFVVQHSYPYMTTGKTIALTIQTFVSKVIYLLLNMLSRFVTAFLPRSKHLLILWLLSPSAVILKPKKIKFVTFNFPHLCAMKWETRWYDLRFLKVQF